MAEVTGGFLSIKGAYVPDQWDVYWTVRRTCHSVLGAIAPPKRVNCVPGVETVAYKQPLVKTMQVGWRVQVTHPIDMNYGSYGSY